MDISVPEVYPVHLVIGTVLLGMPDTANQCLFRYCVHVGGYVYLLQPCTPVCVLTVSHHTQYDVSPEAWGDN